nr:Gldg family protein [Treponema sp.]
EYTNVYSAIVIEYQGNAETIPFTMAANSLEYDLDGRIKHLLTGKSRNVNIIIGNGMSLTEDYSYLLPWLNSQGFIANPLYIEDPAFVSALEASSGPLLVIGDEEIKIEEAIAIENYLLSNKGNGFFCISPFSVNIDDDWNLRPNTSTNIVEMLENWGLRFSDKIAGDISNARITMYSEDQTQTQVINYPLWISLLPQENTKEGITIFWPCPLELSEGPASPYLSSSPMSFAIDIDKDSPDKLIETNPFLLESLNISNFEKSSQVLGAQIKGPLQGYYNLLTSQNSNIIVIPDQYFLSSLMTGYIGGQYGDYRNFDFLATSLLRLNGEEELAQLKSKANRDASLYKVNDIEIFVKYQLITYLVLFILMPLLILISGVIINVSKKR